MLVLMAGCPFLELDVGGEVHLVQVVVDEITNVPGQVVVPEVRMICIS